MRFTMIPRKTRVLLALVLASGFLLGCPRPDVPVPNVTGIREASVEPVLEEAGFNVGEVTREHSSAAREGEVIAQAPRAAALVRLGQRVDVTVSRGSEEPGEVQVPNVVGMVQPAAEAALLDADLVPGAVTTQESEFVSAGEVLSQEPSGGAMADEDSAVDLVIAAAPDPIPISGIEELQKIGNEPAYPADGDYMLTQDIDASETAAWNNGAGFEPIGGREDGDSDDMFSGTLDGQGHAIRDLVIARPDEDFVGLFGTLDDGVIRDIALEDAAVTGRDRTGTLVGMNGGAVSQSHVSGTVEGQGGVGGLVGSNGGGILVGGEPGVIADSYAAASVTGNGRGTGGLVGVNMGMVSVSFAEGEVAGDTAGGLAGVNAAAIVQSFAAGPVTVGDSAGGLVGRNTGWIAESHASGPVTGNERVGGLVGHQQLIVIVPLGGESDGKYKGAQKHTGDPRAFGQATVLDSYAVGKVTGDTESGGLVGVNSDGTVAASFWDTETTGRDISDGGAGLSTEEMRQENSFAKRGWDFERTWRIDEDQGYPYLWWTSD